MEGIQPGYAILSIVVASMSFDRENIIDFSKPIQNNISINKEVSPESQDLIPMFNVIVGGTLIGTQEGNVEVYSIKCRVAGVFQKIGEPELDFQSFSTVNGPAIIFPFLRETISDIGRRAGLNAILLPPINFTKKQE